MIIVYNGNSIDVEIRIDIINEYFFLKIYLLHTNKSILDILNRALAAHLKQNNWLLYFDSIGRNLN